MSLIARRIVARYLSASVLHWERIVEPPYEGAPPRERFEAKTAAGWRYVVSDRYGEWTAEVFKRTGHSLADAFVIADGKEQRLGKRAYFASPEAAKAACEKHIARATTPRETDPGKLAEGMTPGQHRLIMEAYENGGRLEPDWGTRSERPLRQLRTRLLKELEPMGIFHPWSDGLTDLGKAVAEILKRKPLPEPKAPRPRKVPPASPAAIGLARQLLRENGQLEPPGLDGMNRDEVSTIIDLQQMRRKASPAQLGFVRRLLRERGVREPEGLEGKPATWVSSLIDGLQRMGRPAFDGEQVTWQWPSRR